MSIHASSAGKIKNASSVICFSDNFAKNTGRMTYGLYMGAFLCPS
jgi:hypothetical protein